MTADRLDERALAVLDRIAETGKAVTVLRSDLRELVSGYRHLLALEELRPMLEAWLDSGKVSAVEEIHAVLGVLRRAA